MKSAALYKALENGNNALVYIENIHKLSETKIKHKRRLMASSKKSKAKIFISISAKEETVFMNQEGLTELNIPPLESLKEVAQILDDAVKFFVEKDGHGYRRFSLAAQYTFKISMARKPPSTVDLVQSLLSRRDKEIVNVDEIQEIITLQGPGGNI